MIENTIEKPSIFALIRDAFTYVKDHKGWLWAFAKPLAPYMLALTFMSYVLSHYTQADALMDIAALYFVACLSLAWHRTVLQGPANGNTVNPFHLKAENKSFLLTFFMLCFLPALTLMLLAALWSGGAAVGGPVVATICGIVAVALFFYLLIYFVRLSFLLPARSVGADIDRKRAQSISKSLVWRLIVSTSLLSTLVYIVFSIVILVTVLILTAIKNGLLGLSSEELTSHIIDAAFVAPLSVLITCYLTALNITILSRLYQWGVVNNPN